MGWLHAFCRFDVTVTVSRMMKSIQLCLLMNHTLGECICSFLFFILFVLFVHSACINISGEYTCL